VAEGEFEEARVELALERPECHPRGRVKSTRKARSREQAHVSYNTHAYACIEVMEWNTETDRDLFREKRTRGFVMIGHLTFGA